MRKFYVRDGDRMFMKSGMQCQHLMPAGFEEGNDFFGRSRRHHQAMPPQGTVEHRVENLAPFKGESVNLIHDKQVEIIGVTEKLMGRQDQAIAREHLAVPSINGDDFVFGEGGCQTRVQFNDDIAPGKGESDAHPTLHRISDDAVADLRFPGSAHRINEGIDPVDKIIKDLIGKLFLFPR